MMKYLLVALSFVFAVPAFAHQANKFVKGPNGGHSIHIGNQHWELVAIGGNLDLYISDHEDKPLDAAGGAAEAQVLVGGKTFTVVLAPAGGNTLKGSGPFTAAKGMRVIVKTSKVAGESLQARLTPLQ